MSTYRAVATSWRTGGGGRPWLGATERALIFSSSEGSALSDAPRYCEMFSKTMDLLGEQSSSTNRVVKSSWRLQWRSLIFRLDLSDLPSVIAQHAANCTQIPYNDPARRPSILLNIPNGLSTLLDLLSHFGLHVRTDQRPTNLGRTWKPFVSCPLMATIRVLPRNLVVTYLMLHCEP